MWAYVCPHPPYPSRPPVELFLAISANGGWIRQRQIQDRLAVEGGGGNGCHPPGNDCHLSKVFRWMDENVGVPPELRA